MKVMVIIKQLRTQAGVMPSEQLLTEMGQYNEDLVKAGILLREGLHPSSKGARVRFSAQIAVSPMAIHRDERIDCRLLDLASESMEEAIAWVKRCPNPMLGESEIEIRPVFYRDDLVKNLPGTESASARSSSG